MTYIDSAILNLTEWFCRQFQLLTGRTNVWLAVQFTNLSIIVYFVWAGVYFWSRGVAARIAVGLFCSGLLYVLTQTNFKVPIEAYENEAYRRVAKGFRNPRRVRDAQLRISFLTLSFVLFYPILFVYMNLRLSILLLTYSLIVLTTVVLYLLACDPLPPSAAKLKQWLRGSAPSRLSALESSRIQLANVSHFSSGRRGPEIGAPLTPVHREDQVPFFRAVGADAGGGKASSVKRAPEHHRPPLDASRDFATLAVERDFVRL
jgi:hypothetical protein